MNLEDELKLALQRKEPPPGFRQRVLAATSERTARPRHPYRSLAAAALLTLLLGGTTAHFIEQRREGERAKEQVLQALRITSHELRDTREHIQNSRNEVAMRKVLLALLILAVTTPLQAQKVTIDIPGLADKAREVVDITLDAQMLRLASKFLSSSDEDERAVRGIVSKLEGIYVRSYEFDKDGEYDRALVDKVRAQLGPSWKKIVNVRSKLEKNAEIYLDMRGGDQPFGLLVISAEPRQLTIVNIVGPIDLDQLAHLEGEFGIPKMSKRGDHE